MKYLAIAFLALPLCAFARKNNLYTDVGYGGLSNLGASVTYNHQLIKYFGIGGGIQGYNYLVEGIGNSNVSQFTPGIFGDLRGYLPVNRSLMFLFLDLGLDVYHSSPGTAQYHENGFYAGMGLGYCYRINKRGMGPYIALKMVSDAYKTTQYNPATRESGKVTNTDGMGMVCLGFKF